MDVFLHYDLLWDCGFAPPSIRQQLHVLELLADFVDGGFGDVVVADVEGTEGFHFLEEAGDPGELVVADLDLGEGGELGEDAGDLGELVVTEDDLAEAGEAGDAAVEGGELLSAQIQGLDDLRGGEGLVEGGEDLVGIPGIEDDGDKDDGLDGLAVLLGGVELEFLEVGGDGLAEELGGRLGDLVLLDLAGGGNGDLGDDLATCSGALGFEGVADLLLHLLQVQAFGRDLGLCVDSEREDKQSGEQAGQMLHREQR